MKYKYMRDDLDNSHGFLELQDKILEIMVNVHNFCEKHNIEYCLMGGSALGSKRHAGFIPWDDDLDIFMTPNNYEKFREELKKSNELPNYYLQELGVTENMVTMAKIRDTNTTYLESAYKGWNMNHGIFVDIFILHTSPNNKLLRLHQFLWARYVVCKGLANRDYKKRKNLFRFLIKFLRLFPTNFLIRHGLKQLYKYKDKNTSYYCNFLGKAGYKKGLYKKEWMYPFKLVNFEKVQLYAPRNLDEFLKCRFGEYMNIPSAEKIKWEQHAELWDTKKSYVDLLNINSNSDEKRLM